MAPGVLCDKRIPIGLKCTFHKTDVGPAMLYGSRRWAVDKKIEQRINVTEMRRLRCSSGATENDTVRKKCIQMFNYNVTHNNRYITSNRLILLQYRDICWFYCFKLY